MRTQRRSLHTVEPPAHRLNLLHHLGQIVRRADPRRLKLHDHRVHDMTVGASTLRLIPSSTSRTRTESHPNPQGPRATP